LLLLLAVLGVALVALGALVLLRFPDRPGGKVRFLGLEVSSVGGGLPLIALGMLAVVVAVQQRDGDQVTTDGSSGGGAGQVAGPPPESAPACIAHFFGIRPEVHKERRRTLPAEAEDVDVLGAAEPKLREFGLVLTDRRKVVGAAKLRYDTDVNQFYVDAVVDAGCERADWTADDTPGSNPSLVNNFNDLTLALSAGDYIVELKANSEVEMELHRFQR